MSGVKVIHWAVLWGRGYRAERVGVIMTRTRVHNPMRAESAQDNIWPMQTVLLIVGLKMTRTGLKRKQKTLLSGGLHLQQRSPSAHML